MATPTSGRYAAIKLGTDLVGGVGEWDLTIDAKEVDATEFGSTWAGAALGMLSWKASFKGFLDLTDAQQQTLWDYVLSGDVIPDLRLYINTSTGAYWVPDVATYADAGGRIKSLKLSSKKDDIAKAEFEIVGYGPITYVNP